MRLADTVLRRGHLSESALIEVWTTGVRPAHLDRCDQCARHALDVSRWLEDVQALGREDADAVFSDDRLTAQRGQVLSRLAQLDRPSKVISFPAASAAAREPFAPQRGRTAWLATAAAAAGIMIGVVGMELSHMVSSGGLSQTAPPSVTAPGTDDDSSLLDHIYDRPSVGGLDALDGLTPRVADIVMVSR